VLRVLQHGSGDSRVRRAAACRTRARCVLMLTVVDVSLWGVYSRKRYTHS